MRNLMVTCRAPILVHRVCAFARTDRRSNNLISFNGDQGYADPARHGDEDPPRSNVSNLTVKASRSVASGIASVELVAVASCRAT